MTKPLQRNSGGLLDRFAKRYEIQVRIDRFGADRSFEFLAMNLFIDALFGAGACHEVHFTRALDIGDQLVERTPRREARTMREQMTNDHAILSMHAEAREIARDAIVEAKFLLAHQHHYRDGGGEDLGQRREIEHGIDFCLAPMRQHCAKAEGALEKHLVGATRYHGRCGEDVSLDGVIERLLYLTPSQAQNLRMMIRWENTSAQCGYTSEVTTEFQDTPDSRIVSRCEAESIRARTPNGSARLLVKWPASIPNRTGISSPAVCSAAKRKIMRASFSSPPKGRIAPKTMPAQRPSAPDWRNCTSIRSMRYARSPTSSRNKILPSKFGA